MLTLKQAAEYLGMHPATLYDIVARTRSVNRGRQSSGPTIKYFQISKSSSIKFKQEWLDTFIEENSTDATKSPKTQQDHSNRVKNSKNALPKCDRFRLPKVLLNN